MAQGWASVRELDADHGDSDCQITLIDAGRPMAVRSADSRALSLVALAFASSREVQVELFAGTTTVSVVHLRGPREGPVVEYRYEVASGRAWVRLDDGRLAWTAHAAMQIVVEAAIQTNAPLGDIVILEATSELKRAKCLARDVVPTDARSDRH